MHTIKDFLSDIRAGLEFVPFGEEGPAGNQPATSHLFRGYTFATGKATGTSYMVEFMLGKIRIALHEEE